MSNGGPRIGGEPVQPSIDVRRSGALTHRWLDLATVGVVVVSLFFERLDRSLYLHRTSVIPDVTFDAAVILLSLRYLREVTQSRARLTWPTRREYVVIVFVLFVFVVGLVSLVSLPSWISSGSQVLKSTVHLGFLAYAAFLIGRSFSKELVEFAFKLYFGLAAAAGALTIVQALDLNAGNGSLTRHLHLIYRLHSNGYKGPCSIFSEPAELGYVMVAALVIALLRWRSIGRNRTIVGAALCALALFLSLPAGPLIVATVLGLILAVEQRRRVSHRAWAALGVVIVLLAAVALASPVGAALYGRASGILNGSDPSAQYRKAVDSASIRIWRIAPATGIGIGNTRRLLPFVYHSTPVAPNPTGFNDSNGYLSLLGETGVLGVLAALAALAAIIWPSARPARFATVTQLNTIGVAVSYLVAGSFLLPALWFWGGLRLATIRNQGQPDRFDGAVYRLRGLTRTSLQRPSPVGAFLALLVVAAVASVAYGFRVQSSHRSLLPVSKDGIVELTAAAHAGDAGLARRDKNHWSRRFCKQRDCRASLHFIEGRVWEIRARWRSGTVSRLLSGPVPAKGTARRMWIERLNRRDCGSICAASLRHVRGRIWEIRSRWPAGTGCLVLDLASFGTTKPEPGSVTSGFTGLSTCPYGAG